MGRKKSIYGRIPPNKTTLFRRLSESFIKAPMDSPIDIESILLNGAVVPHFQPLVSMRRRSIVGFEGLSRGWDTQAEALIPAPRLFAAAADKGLSRELDLLCREKILGEFAVLHEADPELILSVNIEASSAMAKKPWGDYLNMQVAAVGVTPRNVIIEILESVVDDTQELVRFVDRHREAGFLIALDDVGAGHSNLNRIPLIRPDVIKVDRYLVEGLDQDLHKQEVFKSLLSMARHLGTVIVAEGAENEAEVTALLALGVDMIQGYYFSTPKKGGISTPRESTNASGTRARSTGNAACRRPAASTSIWPTTRN